jgi:hypothetical protein
MGMRKRIVLSLGMLVTLCAIGLLGLQWLTASRHHITAANIAKISPGMSQEDVQGLLGAPPGYEAPGRMCGGICLTGLDEGLWQRGKHECWVGEEVAVLVFFDAEGHVLRYLTTSSVPIVESFLEKLRRWFHL